jgi:hypothetical protein
VKIWKVMLISTLITLAIGGIYLFSVWKQRQNPGVIPHQEASDMPSKDDLVVMRAFSPAHYADLKRLEATTVWMKNGYTMPYFPYVGDKIEFAAPAGLIPAALRMDVKKIVKASVPSNVDDGIEHGTQQAFAVFALPGSAKLYATAVGTMDSRLESYYTDMLFFYDDPHSIYAHWPADVWATIDAHQVKPGMSELETQMALGNKLHADGKDVGNRTVNYDQDGKQWTVTYVKNRATAISTAAKSS